MAKLELVNTAFILKWEGGLSKDKNDTASANTVPDGSGYHTNKGITWAVWNHTFGNDIKGFYEMQPKKWLLIYKKYFDAVGGDYINSQRIAELFADWCWGSGTYAQFGMQKWLNKNGYKLVFDGKVGQTTLSALNNLIENNTEKWVFDSIYAYRIEWIKGLPQFKTFGKGWMRRLNDFYLIYG